MAEEKLKLIAKAGTNPKTKEELYYGQVKSHSTKTYKNCDYEGSGLTEDTMAHALGKIVKEIRKALMTGENFKIDGLGTFKIKVKTKGKKDYKDLDNSEAEYNGLQFLVDTDLRKKLSSIKFEYDKSVIPVRKSSQENPSDVEEGGGEGLGSNSSNKE